ncbi:hypothetical protein OAJ14_04830 [Polaribacter sp.]|nr:hypothetical protein [Polaribacter sp.]
MKKIVLTLVLLVAFTATYGQKKWQMKKINYFVDAAAKDFNLDKEAKAKLLKVRTAYFMDYMKTMKAAKAEGLEQAERRKKLNVINQAFNKDLIEITGKTGKEIQPFLKKMREELKDVK